MLLAALAVLAVVAVFWTDTQRGRKLLVKWGVPEPSEPQVKTALHYRRLRWACYPFLLAATALVTDWVVGDDDYSGLSIPVALLLSAAIAELLALPTSRHAPPVRHPLFSLVPKWGVAFYSITVLTTIVLGFVDLSVAQYATSMLADNIATGEDSPFAQHVPFVVPLVATAVVLLAVAVVLRMSATRSFSADSEVDRALRVRSARVALALGAVSQVFYALPLAYWRIPAIAGKWGSPPNDSAVDWAHQVDGIATLPLVVLVYGTLACWPMLASPPNRRGLFHKRTTGVS
ncbi:hypothetical protein OU415_13650 [Saccharopolyspora sp. WRP15-2]|uniref:Uncharacterized protein n=1 Tax=Saccharopolyspora oryzae TaxID=2997343 RepID=A0ABT4UXP8_9PSEU|nr:hypothetical protein [Saccharopolyspora oryzae]MDA3626485.1 hypothetical protein [Saccharopolyspora oryzae]